VSIYNDGICITAEDFKASNCIEIINEDEFIKLRIIEVVGL